MKDQVQAHCNNCLGERYQNILHTEKTYWSQDDDDGAPIVDGGCTYRMLKCCGCGSISMQGEHWFSEDFDNKGRPVKRKEYFPPATYRNEPEWLDDIENDYVEGILKEIYISLKSGSRRLAAMGIRACLEHVMIKEVGDHGTFIKNIDAFQAKGYISKIQREALDLIIEAGHATIHRAFHPSIKQTTVLVDITESILESIYINSSKADLLRRKIPHRKRK